MFKRQVGDEIYSQFFWLNIVILRKKYSIKLFHVISRQLTFQMWDKECLAKSIPH